MKGNQTLNKAVLRILKPLVRILIENKVSHSEFSELAREAFAEVAQKDFAIPHRKNTYSRIAVLTGLSRKEVVRLLNRNSELADPKLTPNRAARVISGWLYDPDFQSNDSLGQPKRLPLKGDNSFTNLVERYSGDITAGAILDELIRLGIVSMVENDQVILERDEYVPTTGEIEKFDILASCVTNMLDTGAFNMYRNESDLPRFQRQLTHRNIPVTLQEEFKKLASQKSIELLGDLNGWLNKEASRHIGEPLQPVQEATQVGLGIYYFQNSISKENQGDE